MANLVRPVVELGSISLNQVSDRTFEVDLRGARAASVTATKLFGAWANKTFEVKKMFGARIEAFGSPKTIAAGGGTISLTSDDITGVSGIAVVMAGAADAGYAMLTVTLEAEAEAPLDGRLIVNPRFAPGDESRPGQPQEV